MRTETRFGIAAAVGGLLLPSLASAQAWVPGTRQLWVSTGYQYLDAGNHLFSQDIPPEAGGDGSNGLNLGEITGQTLLLGLDYGITDRLAGTATLAYVGSKYVGDDPDAPMDDGTWNHGFQDFGFALRYMALRDPVVVTPAVEVGVPSHSYDPLGHSALGRGLNELRMGLNLGWVGRSFLSGLYLQGSYKYALVEEVDGIRPNRTDLGVDAGYFVTTNLVLRASGGYVNTHDGIDWLEDLGEGHEEAFHTHDQLAKTRAATVGGGLSYSFGPATVGLGVLATVWGENTHESTAFLVSVSRTFTLMR